MSQPRIPQTDSSLAREFLHFVVNEKAWWMTPIAATLLGMVGFILWVEASPVLPFIYSGLL